MPTPEYDVTQPYLGLIEKYAPKPDIEDQEQQKRIAKGNAVAEAFKIIIDAAGGSKGADILDRSQDNPVMKSIDKYYKAKEENKAIEDKTNMLKLGQGIKALETESQQRFTKEQQAEGREFSSGQQVKQQEFQAGESKLTRDQRTTEFDAESKVKADQFRQTFGLAQEKQTTDAEIDRERIAADKEKSAMMYPYGRISGLNIADEAKDDVFRIADDNISQVIAFMEKDPNVQDNIGFIKARFNNLGSTQEVKLLITQSYNNLSEVTKEKIRALSGAPSPTTNPTIKTNKGSTVVEAQPQEQQQKGQALEPDQLAYIQKAMTMEGYTSEVKRSYIYKYLVDQGYDKESAKAAAESVYQVLIGKN